MVLLFTSFIFNFQKTALFTGRNPKFCTPSKYPEIWELKPENDEFSHGFRCPVLAFSQRCLWVSAKAPSYFQRWGLLES